jgi:hypothetical protein
MHITSELQQIPTTSLTLLCRKVAEDPTMEQTILQEARDLKQQWTLLQTPDPIDYATKEELKTKEAAFRTGMIDLLSRILKGL